VRCDSFGTSSPVARQLLTHWSRADAAAWVAKASVRDRVTASEHNSMVVALATIQDSIAAPWDVLGPGGEPSPLHVNIDGEAIPLIGAVEPLPEMFTDATGPARLARWNEIGEVLNSLSLAQATSDHDSAQSEDVKLVLLCSPAALALVHAEPSTIVEEPAAPAYPMAAFLSESILLARSARMSDRPISSPREQLVRDASQAAERMFAAAGAAAVKTMWRLLRRRAA